MVRAVNIIMHTLWSEKHCPIRLCFVTVIIIVDHSIIEFESGALPGI